MIKMAITALIQTYPRTAIIVFSLIISLLITIVNYFVLDQNRMRELKDKQKNLQAEMKKHKDNPQKMMDLQKEMFSHMGENMKHSFKPMLITFIPLIIFFNWLRPTFAGTGIAGNWIWYYIGASIVGSLIFRKLFKMP